MTNKLTRPSWAAFAWLRRRRRRRDMQSAQLRPDSLAALPLASGRQTGERRSAICAYKSASQLAGGRASL